MIIVPFEYVEYIEINKEKEFSVKDDTPKDIKYKFNKWVKKIELYSITKVV